MENTYNTATTREITSSTRRPSSHNISNNNEDAINTSITSNKERVPTTPKTPRSNFASPPSFTPDPTFLLPFSGVLIMLTILLFNIGTSLNDSYVNAALANSDAPSIFSTTLVLWVLRHFSFSAFAFQLCVAVAIPAVIVCHFPQSNAQQALLTELAAEREEKELLKKALQEESEKLIMEQEKASKFVHDMNHEACAYNSVATTNSPSFRVIIDSNAPPPTLLY
eukprot:GEZU01014717.1.p1 GENE.GEZU01014717.1~~GEZU01014717.1.p1  ORF type:complete len:224 (-),score=30.16 GEZU01014717.1:30-701(-)